jgi:hypothetical protein
VPLLPNKTQIKTEQLLKMLHDEFLSHLTNFEDGTFERVKVDPGRMRFENIPPFDPPQLLEV